MDTLEAIDDVIDVAKVIATVTPTPIDDIIVEAVDQVFDYFTEDEETEN